LELAISGLVGSCSVAVLRAVDLDDPDPASVGDNEVRPESALSRPEPGPWQDPDGRFWRAPLLGTDQRLVHTQLAIGVEVEPVLARVTLGQCLIGRLVIGLKVSQAGLDAACRQLDGIRFGRIATEWIERVSPSWIFLRVSRRYSATSLS
jgi:hypothetical protein